MCRFLSQDSFDAIVKVWNIELVNVPTRDNVWADCFHAIKEFQNKVFLILTRDNVTVSNCARFNTFTFVKN